MVDGAQFGLYEDDEPEHRPPWAVLGVLLVAALAVVALSWRAVNTDATLASPEEQGATTTTAPGAPDRPAPTVEDLRLLLPGGVDECAPPPEEPVDGPARAVLRCPGPGAPATVDFTLYGSVEERDDAFDFLAAVLEIPADGGECAQGRLGRHDYVGVEQVGQVACQSAGDRTDVLWTSDAGPLLALATGEGGFAEQYAWWADLVERTDAAFPTGEEQDLLDTLPESLLDDCDRDPDLRLSVGGDLAVTCRPERSPAREVSWIRFAGDEAMGRWLDQRRERQPEQADEASCAEADYDLGGRTGTVLCHRDRAGRAVVVWARDDGRLGSVAVGADGVPVPELMAWWERGGHLP